MSFHEFLSRYRCLVRTKLPTEERSAVKYVYENVVFCNNFSKNMQYHYCSRVLLLLSLHNHAFYRAFLTLQEIPSEECQIGKTKVFLRNKAHEPLEDKRKIMLNLMATIIQRTWRGYFVRKGRRFQILMYFSCERIYMNSFNKYFSDYIKTRSAVIIVQTAFKSWKQRLVFLKKRRAAIVIQSHLRGVFAREVIKVF